MKAPKLSEAQRRVMHWLGRGWTSEPGAGMAIHINGKRVSNVDTLFALERLGLVEQITQAGLKRVGQWKATEKGVELVKGSSDQERDTDEVRE